MTNPYEVKLENELKAAIETSLNLTSREPQILVNQILIMKYLLWIRGGIKV